MKIFGLDTTRKSANIFTFDSNNSEKIYMLKMSDEIRHSEGLFLYIEKAMLDCNTEMADYDYLACVVGPGSFTGIRVGMSTIKGFNKALNKIVVPVNMFEILLPEIKTGIIALNSTSTSVYYAEVEGRKIIETGVINKDELIDKVNGRTLLILKDEQNDISIEYNNYKFIDDLSQLYYKCVMSKIDNGEFSEFMPYYLQLSQAERNLNNE